MKRSRGATARTGVGISSSFNMLGNRSYAGPVSPFRAEALVISGWSPGRLGSNLASRSEMTASISALDPIRYISASKNKGSAVSGSGTANCANLCNQEQTRRPTGRGYIFPCRCSIDPL
jgi:hypothetical protein